MVTKNKDNVKFNDLNIRAKLNCMEQFVNIIVPYADYDDCPNNDLEYVVCDIEEWVGDQFYFDENGDWYDEGRMVR